MRLKIAAVLKPNTVSRPLSGTFVSSAPVTGAKTKGKTRKEKAEASNLRSMIAAKEFELHRLEKLVKKKGSLGAALELSAAGNSTSSGSVTTVNSPSTQPGSTSQAAQALMTVMSSQQSQLKELKDSYLKLTGILYENSTRRRFLGGRKIGNSNKNTPFTAAYAAAAVVTPSLLSVSASPSSEKKPTSNKGIETLISYPKVWTDSL